MPERGAPPKVPALQRRVLKAVQPLTTPFLPRDYADVIFGDALRKLAREHDGFRIHEQHTRANGRMEPAHLDDLCPDWKERETFLSGPAEMLDAIEEHYDAHDCCARLHMERFQT